MLVANSFDLWQRDAFFSAAEEVQESADILESAYRTWVSEKRDGKSSSYSDDLLREMQTALATAKWQLEEFERAVRLSYGNCRKQNGMAIHQQFIVAMESQISRVELALRESLEEEGKEPFRWVNLNADERDDLAMFLSGSHGDNFTKSGRHDFANPSISSKMENLCEIEDLDFAPCSSSSSGVEANIKANGLTSFGGDIVINIGPEPNRGVVHTGIEALGTRGDVYCETDRGSNTKRTRISPKFSTLRVIIPNGDDQTRALIPTIEATPKEKGSRTSSYLQFRAINCFNKLFMKGSSAMKSITRSHGRSQLTSSMRLVILLAVSFFLLVLYLVH